MPQSTLPWKFRSAAGRQLDLDDDGRLTFKESDLPLVAFGALYPPIVKNGPAFETRPKPPPAEWDWSPFSTLSGSKRENSGSKREHDASARRFGLCFFVDPQTSSTWEVEILPDGTLSPDAHHWMLLEIDRRLPGWLATYSRGSLLLPFEKGHACSTPEATAVALLDAIRIQIPVVARLVAQARWDIGPPLPGLPAAVGVFGYSRSFRVPENRLVVAWYEAVQSRLQRSEWAIDASLTLLDSMLNGRQRAREKDGGNASEIDEKELTRRRSDLTRLLDDIGDAKAAATTTVSPLTSRGVDAFRPFEQCTVLGMTQISLTEWVRNSDGISYADRGQWFLPGRLVSEVFETWVSVAILEWLEEFTGSLAASTAHVGEGANAETAFVWLLETEGVRLELRHGLRIEVHEPQSIDSSGPLLTQRQMVARSLRGETHSLFTTSARNAPDLVLTVFGPQGVAFVIGEVKFASAQQGDIGDKVAVMRKYVGGIGLKTPTREVVLPLAAASFVVLPGPEDSEIRRTAVRDLGREDVRVLVMHPAERNAAAKVTFRRIVNALFDAVGAEFPD